MYRRKDETLGRHFFNAVLAAKWPAKHTPGNPFPYFLGKCINPTRDPASKDRDCKCGVSENGNASCFKASCPKSIRSYEVAEWLISNGVKVQNLSFGAKPSGTEKRKIVDVKKLDIIEGESNLCKEFKKYIEDRGVDPVWFADKYPPVSLCLQSLGDDNRYGNVYEADMHYYWEIYPGSYVGRARYDEEEFEKRKRNYRKYDKVKNSDALATPGLIDVVNKQPEILYIVEGYFDALPFPEGTCVPITAQRVIKKDMAEVGDRVQIREVVYLPDSDVPPKTRRDNIMCLREVLNANVEMFEVKDLFPEVDDRKRYG